MLNKEASHERPHIIGFHVQDVSRAGKSTEMGSRLATVEGWRKKGDGVSRLDSGFLFEVMKML